MKFFCKYLILMLLMVVVSCDDNSPKQQQPVTKSEMKSSMEKANRYMLNEEEEDIENLHKSSNQNRCICSLDRG